MIQIMSLEEQKELENAGEIIISVKNGWSAAPWSPTPYSIYYSWGYHEREIIFECYLTYNYSTLTVTNITESKWLKEQNDLPLTDFLACLTVRALKEHARLLNKDIICADTKISLFVDHFINEGFTIERTAKIVSSCDSSDDRVYRGRYYRPGNGRAR